MKFLLQSLKFEKKFISKFLVLFSVFLSSQCLKLEIKAIMIIPLDHCNELKIFYS
jgi:hypothetical protein